MTDKPKVVAIMDKPVTVVDQATDIVMKGRKGVLKGFGKGLQDHIMKGNKFVSITTEVSTGKYPDDHPDPDKAGKWAVQIMLYGSDDEESAKVLEQRITPIIEGFVGARAFRPS